MKKIMEKVERFLNKIRESKMDKSQGLQSASRLLEAITKILASHNKLDSMSNIKEVVLLAELGKECTHLKNIFSALDPKSELINRLKQRNRTSNSDPSIIPYPDLPSSPANVLYVGLLSLFFPQLTVNEYQQLLLPDVAYFIDYEMYLEPGKKRTIVLEKKPINLLALSSIESFSQMVVCGDLAIPITTILLTDLGELKQLYNLLQAHYPQFIPKIFKRNQALILLHQELENYVDFGRSMRQVLETLRDEFIFVGYMYYGEYIPESIVKPLLKLLEQYKTEHVDMSSYDQILQLPYGKGRQSKFAKIDQRIERGECILSTAHKIQEFLGYYPSQHLLLDKQQQRIYTNIQGLSFSTDERTEITINWQNIKDHIKLNLHDIELQLLLILPLDDYPSFFQLLATAPVFNYFPVIVDLINNNKLNKLANDCIARHCYLLSPEESLYYRIKKMAEIDNPNFLRFFLEQISGEDRIEFNGKKIAIFRDLLQSTLKITHEKIKIFLDCLTADQQAEFILSNFKSIVQKNCFLFVIDNYPNVLQSFDGIILHNFLKKIAVFRDAFPAFMKKIISSEKWNYYFFETKHALFFSQQSFESFQFIYENTARDHFDQHLRTFLKSPFANIKHLFKDIRILTVMNEFLKEDEWNNILDPTNYYIMKLMPKLAENGNKAFEFIADKIKNVPAFKDILLHTRKNKDCILFIAARNGLNVMPLVDVLEEDKLFPKLINSSANSVMSYQESAPTVFRYLQKKLSRQNFIAWLAKDYWASQSLFANSECWSIVDAYFTKQDYTVYYQIIRDDFCFSILANLSEKALLHVLQGFGTDLRQYLHFQKGVFHQLYHSCFWAKYPAVFAFVLEQFDAAESFINKPQIILKLIACPESFRFYFKFISSTDFGQKFYALLIPLAAELYKHPDNFVLFFEKQNPQWQFWLIDTLQRKIAKSDYKNLASYAYNPNEPEKFYEALNKDNICKLPLAYLECIFQLCSAPFFIWIRDHKCRMKALFTREKAFEVFHNALLKHPEISENYYSMWAGKTLTPLIALLRNYPKAFTIFLKSNPQYLLLIDVSFTSTILHDYKNLQEGIRSCLKNHWQALHWEMHLAAKNSEGRTPLHLATLDGSTFLFYWQRLLPQAQHSYLFHIDNSGNSVAHYVALRQELCMQVQALLPPEVWQKLLVLKNKEGLTVADFLSLADSFCYRQALEKIMRSNRLCELSYFSLPKSFIEEIMRSICAEYNTDYESFDASSCVYSFFRMAEKQYEVYIRKCHEKLAAITPLQQAQSITEQEKKECDKLIILIATIAFYKDFSPRPQTEKHYAALLEKYRSPSFSGVSQSGFWQTPQVVLPPPENMEWEATNTLTPMELTNSC